MLKRINMKSRGSIQRSDVACLLFGNAEFCRKMMSQILENVFRLRHSGQQRETFFGLLDAFPSYLYKNILKKNTRKRAMSIFI